MPQSASCVAFRHADGSLVNARKENRRHAQPGAQPEISFTTLRDLYDRAFACRHAADGGVPCSTDDTWNSDGNGLRLDRLRHARRRPDAGECAGTETAKYFPGGWPIRLSAGRARKVHRVGNAAWI